METSYSIFEHEIQENVFLYCIGATVGYYANKYWNPNTKVWNMFNATNCWHDDLNNLLDMFFEVTHVPVGPNWKYYKLR